MLRRLRRKVQMIRYYSAPRQASIWTRAMDVALLGSLLLALPVTWMLDTLVAQPVEVMSMRGQLFRTSTGEFNATTLEGGRHVFTTAIGEPVGNFQVTLIDHHLGWPLRTSIQRLPTQIDIDLRIEARPRTRVQLAADDPLRAAIQRVLEVEQQHAAIAAWEMPGAANPTRVRAFPIAWIGSAAVWWIVLTFTSAAIIQMLKFSWTFIGGWRQLRKQRLKAEGKCLSCGYDLTGLEFSARCPECGSLVW